MIEIFKTDTFAKWIDGLQDIRARARILLRIERLETGTLGDVKPVGEGESEMRIDYGPSYRMYYKRIGQKMVILLADKEKNTQSKDINTALRLSRNLQ